MLTRGTVSVRARPVIVVSPESAGTTTGEAGTAAGVAVCAVAAAATAPAESGSAVLPNAEPMVCPHTAERCAAVARMRAATRAPATASPVVRTSESRPNGRNGAGRSSRSESRTKRMWSHGSSAAVSGAARRGMVSRRPARIVSRSSKPGVAARRTESRAEACAGATLAAASEASSTMESEVTATRSLEKRTKTLDEGYNPAGVRNGIRMTGQVVRRPRRP